MRLIQKQCKHIKLTGWSYPHKESLQNLITQKGLYPVTVLPSVTRRDLNTFVRAGIMLARDLLSLSPEALKQNTGIEKKKAEKILGEAYLCSVGSKKQ